MKQKLKVSMIPVGIAIGAGLGVVFHNIPIWVGFGTALGVALSVVMSRRQE